MLEYTMMEGEVNIDYIVNSLYQLNESNLRLNLITEYMLDTNNKRISIVKNQYEGRKQLKYFERIYMDLRENEVRFTLL